MTKIYECCICHKVITPPRKPIRLVKQLYGGKYNQYSYVTKYDFCRECYRKFDAWIYKHSREVSNG